jgi:hypothetical protein
MKTAYLQWITLPISISSYCFVCTQANSGSVYILKKLTCYHDNCSRYFTFGKYNGFVSKARVSACMYFLVLETKTLVELIYHYIRDQMRVFSVFDA